MNLTKEEIYDHYSRTSTNLSVGKFLIFFGLVGWWPLCALTADIVFRCPKLPWPYGVVGGILLVVLGLFFIHCSKQRFRIRSKGTSGTIEIDRGLWKKPWVYEYDKNCKFKFSLTTDGSSSKPREIIQIHLVQGRNFYLIDSRPYGNLLESRQLAEFLCKKTECNMVVAVFHQLELDYADLDIPFYDRIKKYPTLLGEELPMPLDCPIAIKVLHNDQDRIYSWGVKTSGLIVQVLGMFILALIIGFLPIFKGGANSYSILAVAFQKQQFQYFYAIALVFILVVLTLLGIKRMVRVEGHRINVQLLLWGMAVRKSTMLLDELEEIAVKENSNGCSVVLICDTHTIGVDIFNKSWAYFLAQDLRRFVVKRNI